MNSDRAERRTSGRHRVLAVLALVTVGPALGACSGDGTAQIATEPGPIAFTDGAETTTTTNTSTTTTTSISTSVAPSSDGSDGAATTTVAAVPTTTEPFLPPATGSATSALPPVELQLLVAGPDGIGTWSAGRTASVVDDRAVAVAVPDGRGGAVFQDAFATGQWTDSPSQPLRLVSERGGPSTVVLSRSAPILLEAATVSGGRLVVTFLELVSDPARCPGQDGCVGSRAVDRVTVDVGTGQEARTPSARSAAVTATDGTLEAVVELADGSPELIVRDAATGAAVRLVSLTGTGLSGADHVDLTGSGWAVVSQRRCGEPDCLSTVVVVSPSDDIYGPFELPTAVIWATG